MKKKFYIPVLALNLFAMVATAQSENKKVDSTKPARQVVSKNTGEKNLSRQLKEKQIMQDPVQLKKDSLNLAANTASKNKKGKFVKHRKSR